MKRALLTSSAMLISFAVGIAASLAFTAYRSRKVDSPPAPPTASYRCPSAQDVIAAGRYVAVAVADDNEFYIGRNRVALCNISDRVRQLIGDLPAERRIVFVKGKTGIKYETLSSIIDEIHEADVSRVEVIPIKKNRSND